MLFARRFTTEVMKLRTVLNAIAPIRVESLHGNQVEFKTILQQLIHKALVAPQTHTSLPEADGRRPRLRI
jgi:hypothetical protein